MSHHPERNAPFENISQLRQEYASAGAAVISIDTKKKELLGNLHRSGETFTQQTRQSVKRVRFRDMNINSAPRAREGWR